eukprot:3464037-Alexandrium_andersonii.AAC.1
MVGVLAHLRDRVHHVRDGNGSHPGQVPRGVQGYGRALPHGVAHLCPCRMEVPFRVLAAGAPPAAELPREQPRAVGFPAGHAMELGHQGGSARGR